jgi:NOL1/NOP2/fmu family ribosome biogenesis protein
VSDESTVFTRLPATDAAREDPDRPSRQEVLSFFDERFGIPPETFDAHTFWERGAGKIWLYRGEPPSPVDIEGLGMTCLRTRQEHWKPTLEAAQRFGDCADENVIHLDDDAAKRFIAGDDQQLPWEGDWGYLIVTHDIAGAVEPIGVGLYVHGELKSQVPKGRRREL